MEKLRIDKPIIVEGKYDRIALSSVLDATVIPTGGFSIFKNEEKIALLRRLAAERGVILLSDADGGGRQIRARLSSLLPAGSVTHLYIPEIAGKEKRKRAPSREGLLGVEGMDAARLYEIFAPFATDAPQKPKGRAIGKLDLFEDGLSGGKGARARRDALAAALALPRGMSANSLLAAMNLLIDYDEYRAAVEALDTARSEEDQAGAAKTDKSGAHDAIYNKKEGSEADREEEI